MTSLKFKQKGTFAVEFAIVGVVLSLLFVFSMDVIIKLSIKGKLDRLSFSLVNILKERTQLYGEDYLIQQRDANEIFTIAKNSFRRVQDNYNDNNFGAVVEVLTFKSIGVFNPPIRYNLGSYTCSTPKTIVQLSNLSVVTSWERQATIYQVTLCYNTDNIFGSLINKSYTDVSSPSVIIGR